MMGPPIHPKGVAAYFTLHAAVWLLLPPLMGEENPVSL
ncbi:hypothetical protein [Azospirillum palustre]